MPPVSRAIGQDVLRANIFSEIAGQLLLRHARADVYERSRLRSYGSWDANPKIFTFNRSDCAICFSGDTIFAYPLMIQLKNAIDANPKMASRFQRIEVFKAILIKTINSLMTYKSDYEEPKVDFLFGGYCWFRQAFKIWKIEYDKTKHIFFAKQLTNGVWRRGDLPVFFTGDYIDRAKSDLLSILKTKSNFTSKNRLDMEPFQVIATMLASPSREQEHELIGGPPQLLKVYKSLNRIPFAVTWNMNGKDETTLLGMPIFSLSGFPYPIIDSATMKIPNVNSFKSPA